MKWHYQIRGGHTHVRVFMNGAKCGDLCFRNEEFEHIRHLHRELVTFINDDPPKAEESIRQEFTPKRDEAVCDECYEMANE